MVNRARHCGDNVPAREKSRMTDGKDAGARTQAIHDAAMDLDAAPAVDMAYRYFTLVRMLLDDHHGEGYADAHPAIVAAMIQAAAQQRLATVIQEFAESHRGDVSSLDEVL
jgi:hypothetical protein